jgi:hypothetical protein
MKPLSQAGKDISQRMSNMSTAIQAGNRQTLTAALQTAKKHHLAVIESDSGGDLRLSGAGRKGAKVGARYDIISGGADASGTVSKTGPLHLLANPTKPHVMPRARKRGGRRVLVIPGIGVRAFANHPGTKGKDTWAKGRRKAEPFVGAEVSKRTTNILRKAM